MKDYATPYPFQQAMLYNARQPTIFMIDNGESIWMWQGWWPKEDTESKWSLLISAEFRLIQNKIIETIGFSEFLMNLSRSVKFYLILSNSRISSMTTCNCSMFKS